MGRSSVARRGGYDDGDRPPATLVEAPFSTMGDRMMPMLLALSVGSGAAEPSVSGKANVPASEVAVGTVGTRTAQPWEVQARLQYGFNTGTPLVVSPWGPGVGLTFGYARSGLFVGGDASYHTAISQRILGESTGGSVFYVGPTLGYDFRWNALSLRLYGGAGVGSMSTHFGASEAGLYLVTLTPGAGLRYALGGRYHVGIDAHETFSAQLPGSGPSNVSAFVLGATAAASLF